MNKERKDSAFSPEILKALDIKQEDIKGDRDVFEVQLVNETEKVQRDDFKILQVIGTGSYGKVYLVRKLTGNDKNRLYAMKVLKKVTLVYSKQKEKIATNSDQTQVERNILKELRHPFIVKLHYAFQTKGRIYLILDYIPGGELFEYLTQERTVLEDTAAFFLAQLVLALEHLHGLGIIYRDLKPENILLNDDGYLCLTDFGLSKVTLEGKTKVKRKFMKTVCGTTDYMPPEIVTEQQYDNCVDWWSLGILAFDMLVGMANNHKETMERIKKEKPKFPKYISADARDLITRLLKKNPQQRLGSSGAQDIKKHRFFRKIDWNKIEKKQVDSPVKLVKKTIEEKEDMPVIESPVETPLSASVEELFKGFSYMNLELLDMNK